MAGPPRTVRDPKEMEAFKAKYGYDLAVPKDFKQLLDIAEFFTRLPENKYGVALYTQTAYDAVAMGLDRPSSPMAVTSATTRPTKSTAS